MVLTAGGTAASSTRSTSARSPTATATGSATCAASGRLDHLAGLGRRRHLAVAGHVLAQRRLGLRRRRLPRRPSRVRDPGRSRRADRARRAAGHPGPPRPRPQPHERSPPVVRRVALGRGLDAPRLVRVGRPQARRGPPNNWVSSFGGPAWTARRGIGAVLPAQLPAGAARPQLVVRRRAHAPSTTSCASGGTAAWPASASTSAT